MTKIHYRARLQQWSPNKPSYDEYIEVRKTPKGIVVVPRWLSRNYQDKSYLKRFEKLVLNDTINKWYYPTKEEALQGLIKRTERRKKILTSQLEAVNKFLDEGVHDNDVTTIIPVGFF